MAKHKITSIIMGIVILTGVVADGSAINNVKKTNDNAKVVNKVLLAAPSNSGEKAVVINTDNSPLVLYSNASANSSIVSYISVGEMLTIQSSGDNFYKVKVEETGATGYISAHNLQIITSGVNQVYSKVNKKGYVINVSSDVNLRSEATMNSSVIAKLTNNTKINVLGEQGEWFKINCNGREGYIYKEYVGLTNSSVVTGTSNKVSTASSVKAVNNISSNIGSNKTVENSSNTNVTSNKVKSNIVNTNSNNEKLANLKSYYLKQLSDVENKIIDVNKSMSDAQFVKDSLANYKMWDNSLNSIYNAIKENVSPQKASQLEEDQANWKVEQNARDMQISSQGGSESFANTASYLSRSTKERCYYLVNNYL